MSLAMPCFSTMSGLPATMWTNLEILCADALAITPQCRWSAVLFGCGLIFPRDSLMVGWMRDRDYVGIRRRAWFDSGATHIVYHADWGGG